MEWTRRKAVIIYVVFLFICFALGGGILSDDNVISYEIVCKNGSVESFTYDDKYICGGYPNPLRKNIIEKDKLFL